MRAMFRLAARHPSMLGFLREVTRLGPAGLDPPAGRAHAAGRPGGGVPRGRDGRRADPPPRPRLILLAAYSMVTGMATEVEVLRAFGEEPTLASLVRRRNELLALLRDAPAVAGAVLGGCRGRRRARRRASASRAGRRAGQPPSERLPGQRLVEKRLRRSWRSTASRTSSSIRSG